MSHRTDCRSSFIALLLLLAGLIAVGTAGAQGGAAPQTGVRRALLIGINDYKAVPGLQGSVNDVETMREVLISRWGFAQSNVRVLTNQAATRDGILAALEDLVAITGPEDTVYLHYSGHGSEVEDLNGDEESGLDQTLVPQNGRSGTVRDIVDDELAAIIARLRARAAIIVLDSCHSGTATRSIDIRARSVPRDTRVELYRQATRTRAIIPAMHSRYVVLSATAATEEALDGPVDGHYAGFFTHSLAKSMSMAPAGATLKDVFAGVGRELTRLQTEFGRDSMPEPQLEAPAALLEQPLFTPLSHADAAAPAAQEARLPWLSLLPLTRTNGRLEKAVLLDAAVGSKWAIYPPGETQFPPGAALGVATVERIDGQDALVRLDSGQQALDAGSRAVALLPAPAAAAVPVRLMAMSAAQQAKVKQLLSRDIVKVVNQDQPARFLMDAQGDDVRLLTADGLHVVGQFNPDAGGAADLTHLLQQSANAAEVLSLDNPGSRLMVTAHVAGHELLATRGIAVVADTQPAQLRIRRPNEVRAPNNSLQLEIKVNSDAYLTIVDVDSEGQVNLLFPNSFQQSGFYRDGAVRAGDRVLIPDSLQSGNQAGFYWDYSPPHGMDTVRVFAASDLATAVMIRQRILAMRGSAAQPGLSGTRSVSEGVAALRDDFVHLATRGISVVADADPDATHALAARPSAAAADWAATSLSVEVHD